jgi:hypothetical protein
MEYTTGTEIWMAEINERRKLARMRFLDSLDPAQATEYIEFELERGREMVAKLIANGVLKRWGETDA